ncbi:LysR family transcriptional regulator [Streptomyces spiroverticillatus]|uniref:LysR family transcriptional regulator n=1 Tax=Streptomyces finlayi TaxID=67296 RepID=A0A918X857_9ACTN|nr:LysR family transcriptional regulator [Streptomyces finlayi]GHA44627.1 LysR family transcriptional regulator [Streptomyces spiroverticillatus]GHD17884.1 LysR family transcriptional regulator [Streptomyces finlayi]
MNPPRLDLNLVIALRALLEERNVTRAGERIGLSQPAMSAALSRLRRHFDDDLLMRSRGAYELTPLGLALRERSASACDLLDRLFSAQADFDPAAANREFTLLTSDYGAFIFGAELSRRLHQEAPGIRLTFQQTSPAMVENPATMLSTVDGLLMPHGIIEGFPTINLYEDRWVCIVADDHADLGDALSLEDLAHLPWVVYQRPYDAPATRQLSMLGISPRVEVSVQSFQLLPRMVEGTRRIAMIQERLAQRITQFAAVRMLPCPFEAVPVRETMWWHPLHDQDAAHIWLRQKAAEVGATLGEEEVGHA